MSDFDGLDFTLAGIVIEALSLSFNLNLISLNEVDSCSWLELGGLLSKLRNSGGDPDQGGLKLVLIILSHFDVAVVLHLNATSRCYCELRLFLLNVDDLAHLLTWFLNEACSFAAPPRLRSSSFARFELDIAQIFVLHSV